MKKFRILAIGLFFIPLNIYPQNVDLVEITDSFNIQGLVSPLWNDDKIDLYNNELYWFDIYNGIFKKNIFSDSIENLNFINSIPFHPFEVYNNLIVFQNNDKICQIIDLEKEKVIDVDSIRYRFTSDIDISLSNIAHISVGSNPVVVFHQEKSGKYHKKEYNFHLEPYSMELSNTGNCMAIGCDSGKIEILNLNDSTNILSTTTALRKVWHITISGDSGFIGASDEYRIFLCSVDGNKACYPNVEKYKWIKDIKFIPGTDLLAVLSEEYLVIIDGSNGKIITEAKLNTNVSPDQIPYKLTESYAKKEVLIDTPQYFEFDELSNKVVILTEMYRILVFQITISE